MLMDIDNIHRFIDKAEEESIGLLKKLVAQPSISATNIGVKECAKLLSGIMSNIGIHTKIFDTEEEQPIIYGEIMAKNKNSKTVLFYGHYDVQPPEPLNEWHTPPFEPTIINKRLYGRGTADSKGQILAHVLAVSAFINCVDCIPVNVKFVYEGGEESGSKSLAKFVKQHRDLLDADLVFTADGGRHNTGAPIIYFGSRGLLNLEISLQSAKHDNHSGNKGGVISNAAWDMVNLLTTMKDREGNITINSFYENVELPTEHDLELLKKIPYSRNNFAKICGVKEILLDKIELYKRLFFKPTLTINGIKSGYIGAGSKTIIPSHATAKIDTRLACNQDPNVIYSLIQEHLIKHKSNVKIIKHGSMYPSRTPVNTPICKLAINAVAKSNNHDPIIIPIAGGSFPDYVWTRILRLPSLLVPYGNADQSNHAPNENIELDCYMKGIHTSAQLMHEFNQKG